MSGSETCWVGQSRGSLQSDPEYVLSCRRTAHEQPHEPRRTHESPAKCRESFLRLSLNQVFDSPFSDDARPEGWALVFPASLARPHSSFFGRPEENKLQNADPPISNIILIITPTCLTIGEVHLIISAPTSVVGSFGSDDLPGRSRGYPVIHRPPAAPDGHLAPLQCGGK